MSTQIKNTISNSIIVAIFTIMIAGIASWMVTAIKENTKAVQANTVLGYENKLLNQQDHAQLSGLIIGLNYDIVQVKGEITHVKHNCKENKARVDRYIRILKER